MPKVWSMSKSKIFVYICISFTTGILLASVYGINPQIVYLVMGFIAPAFAFAFYSKYFKTALLVALIFFVCLGALRFESTVKPSEYKSLLETKQQLEGYIVEDIDIRTDKQFITFQPNGYRQRILITATKANEYFYGDWVAVKGKIKEPKEFDDFDYPGYLKRFNVYALMSYPQVLVLKNSRANPVKEFLLKIKYAFVRHVNKYLKEPKSSLLLGILIGARKTLPQSVVDNFNATGTSHIVAISGFNITIIIAALAALARLFGRRTSFWISLAIIAAFVILSGGSASVIRAALMGVLLLTSFNIGRMYSITPALAMAGAGMLLINPKILYWDIGFQLSFVATAGIVYLLPELEKLTEDWPTLLGAKSIVFATFAATISTLPLILFYFGRLSVVALIVNVLILPLVPWAMLLGFLIALPLVSPGFALVADWLLEYILKVTEYFASLPFASVEIKFSAIGLIIFSIGVLAFYLLLKKWNKIKR
ncbi:MAG: hypothetical protein COT92_00165 [Candidatus Doudnabacteria bacterium CG10_big_fil_rev_8_21_14_0_10_42_18]|uniref:ComEC/Rec2-related protein domain-containing protein n=1 Tax=Candidatus Doudnabacteria bacterium CG10_big_fil_rev_8_21_14_0_10_42_18 TaxID=1974552 RepID=A0A2H0VC07_9BACT|nr:MAG: hypothetical protein COT92_00165 [Candidatus Doudnabacteria bacterium CG10_big_fil_rev_8_21_14_0_10_42_18]